MDTENRLVREYVGFFGYKNGSWKDLDDFPYITVLKSRSGIAFFSQSNRSTSLIEDDFEVYLLTKNHRLKVLIQKFETKEVALMHAKNFSTLIKSEIVVYNPVVSEKRD